MTEFNAFPKIPRLFRDILVTEKIDGTNAQVVVPEDPALPVLAACRSRYITPEKDNFGFARWVQENQEELRKLGPGRHYGEWWGSGIQRGYGLNEKRFSLFNVGRWVQASETPHGQVRTLGSKQEYAPACCHVVPVLYEGPMSTTLLRFVLSGLELGGSRAAPGFMAPEGIVVFHAASGVLFKATIKNDEKPKGNGGDDA